MSRNRRTLTDAPDSPQSRNSPFADEGATRSHSLPERGPSDSGDTQYSDSVANEKEAVLSCLATTGGCLPLIQLSRAVAQKCEEIDGDEVPEATLQRYYLELRSVTVNELEEHDLVTYCDVDGTIQLTSTGEKYVAYGSL